MIKLKRNPFYNFFPLFSIISGILIRLIELNYPTREPHLFREYVYFNVLQQVFYLFLVAYLVPLFLSINLKKNLYYIINVLCIVIVAFYIVCSSYLFFVERQVFFLPRNISIISSVLVGGGLGVAASCTNQKK